jgi:hypothetical protein
MALQNLTAGQLKALSPQQLAHFVEDVYLSITSIDEKESVDSQYCQYWPLIRQSLIIAKFLTHAETDQRINEVLELGDTVCAIRGLN